MSTWNKGPDRIPKSIAAVNERVYTALFSIWNRVQGPKLKRSTVVALGASPAVYTNSFPYPVEIVAAAAGGSVLNSVVLTLSESSGVPFNVAVYQNPGAVADTSSGLVLLHPTDAVTVTYAGAAPGFSVIER